MIKIERKVLEKKLKKKVISGAVCLGVDTATRAGWCLAEVKDKYVELDFGFINIASKDILEKYNYLITFFDNFLKNKLDPKNENCSVVIEDVFFGKNINTLKVLSRIGMIVYVLSWLYKIPRRFVLAITARSYLGFKSNVKKQIVQKQVKETLDLNIEDEDIIDAIVLALNGVLRDNNLDI